MALETLLRRFFDDVWNKADMPAADEIFEAGHVLHDPTHSWVARGAEGMKRLVSAYQTGFPDLRVEVAQIVAAGPLATTRYRLRGTHAGPFFHFAPSGRAVDVAAVQVDHLGAAKIAETWAVWDTLGLYLQIGAAPRALRQDSEEAQLSYRGTHKRWWQADERGADEPHRESPGAE